MAKESKEQNNQELQIENLKLQIENLSGKISKPQSSEEAFQAREALYESRAAERAELQAKINQRRMEIMSMPELMGKARMDEVIVLEAWERRAKLLEKTNPHFSDTLKAYFKRKIRDIKQDIMR